MFHCTCAAGDEQRGRQRMHSPPVRLASQSSVDSTVQVPEFVKTLAYVGIFMIFLLVVTLVLVYIFIRVVDDKHK